MIDSLNEDGFKYCESNYWNNPAYSDFERELVRFRWGRELFELPKRIKRKRLTRKHLTREHFIDII